MYWHGSGFTGSGELKLASRATIELTATGVRVLTSSTEIGQGTRTMHAQIVADALGIPYEQVEIAAADTAVVPDSGPTVASRTCMVVGRILQRAAEEIRAKLGEATPAEHYRRHGPLAVTSQYEQPDWIQWDEVNYRGDAYATYAWGCDVAEVELDPDTWEVRPLRITVVNEIGQAIHPALARGQIEGGTAQGLGYALLERVTMRDGVMANAQLTNYLIPTTMDTPKLDVILLEHPYAGGPFGAKGLGELPIDGPAPAVVNAIRHLGVDVRAIPALAGGGEGGGLRFTLNAREVDLDVAPMARLLDVLREDCGLTGTKEGCGEGECGACTVLVNGEAVCSCLVPAAQVEGAEVTTIEGLGDDHPLQRAFMDEVGAQCGICTPGMILTALTLGPRPTLAKIRQGLAGNLCRCTGYEAIYRAIRRGT